ncbi:hypothetical protein Agub_g1552, partial [Astrephomene gubernaculifera]
AAWHETAFSQVAEAIRSCPVSVQQVRMIALQLLQEQRQQEQQQEGQQGGQQQPTSSSPSDPAPLPDASSFPPEQLQEACLTVSSQLPQLLLQLTVPRVALPPQLLQLLEELGAQVAEAALGAAEQEQERSGEAAEEEEEEGGGLVVDGMMYAQQVVSIVMQAFLVSSYPVPQHWLDAVAPLMSWGRAVWAPGSSAPGELEHQVQLLLAPEQLTTLMYLAGRGGLQ